MSKNYKSKIFIFQTPPENLSFIWSNEREIFGVWGNVCPDPRPPVMLAWPYGRGYGPTAHQNLHQFLMGFPPPRENFSLFLIQIFLKKYLFLKQIFFLKKNLNQKFFWSSSFRRRSKNPENLSFIWSFVTQMTKWNKRPAELHLRRRWRSIFGKRFSRRGPYKNLKNERHLLRRWSSAWRQGKKPSADVLCTDGRSQFQLKKIFF